MARLLAQEIPHRIPNNFDVVSESINQGIPALKMARSSAISKSLVDFVQHLAEAPQSTSRSMIRRLFDRHPANA
jgi:pilus assembly protein CpaE